MSLSLSRIKSGGIVLSPSNEFFRPGNDPNLFVPLDAVAPAEGYGVATATGTAVAEGYSLHYGYGSATATGSAVGEGLAPSSAAGGAGIATATGTAVGEGYTLSYGYGQADAIASAVGMGPESRTVEVTTGGGGSARSARKRKARIVRYSDFETREAFEQAIRAVIPAPMPPAPVPIEDDDDDDDVVAQLLMMMH